jgi:hypothetical protein
MRVRREGLPVVLSLLIHILSSLSAVDRSHVSQLPGGTREGAFFLAQEPKRKKPFGSYRVLSELDLRRRGMCCYRCCYRCC